MKEIIGYTGTKYKVLAEKQIHSEHIIYLIQCSDNRFAYGTLRDIQSLFFVPINQYGTAEEIISHCKSIIDLCYKQNKKLKQQKTKDVKNPEGWNLLINSNLNEIDGLTNFINALSQ